MGRPTTSLTDSAAPPRASPSSLVRMTPSSASVWWNDSADVDRVLAGHGVDDEERVVGLDRLGDAADLVHQLGVDGQPAGGVDDARRRDPCGGPRPRPARATADRIGRLAEDRHVDLAAERAQLLDGGRALEVGADQQRVAALAT